jgi:membrane protein DedA with SNARE-associated domain/membrane-associated phospholipid phosphatase
MSDKLGPILQWLNLHPNLAGLATFIICAAESIALIGTIIPGTIVMTAIGTLIGAGVIPIWSTFIWAILGAVLGDNISYWIGHHFKDNIRKIWPFRTRPQWLAGGEKFFHRFGSMSVLIGRFFGPLRAIVPVVAGMLKMRPLRFILSSIIASSAWAPIYMLPGIIIGEAAMELPPDMAANLMLRLILMGLFSIFCIWIIFKTLVLISSQLNNALTAIWKSLERTRYCRFVTKALKHHDSAKTHGQIILAFYLVVVSVLFAYLVYFISLYNPLSIGINRACFYLFRSLRSLTLDNVMIFITLLGDKKVLIPVIGVLLIILAIKKRWRMLIHAIALFGFTAAGILLFKHITHIVRPWGITSSPETFSFPSGHTTLATSFYIGLALMLAEGARLKNKYWLYTFVTLIVLAVSVSRLYLGAHWFTDILGGWLLAATVLMLVVLSYNRQTETAFPVKQIFVSMLMLVLVVAGGVDFRNHEQLNYNYGQLDWPNYYVSLDSWWTQDKNIDLPLYRIGRVGIPIEVLNLQWVGKLEDIKQQLIAQGWEVPSKQDWAGVLQRITDLSSSQHLPLVSPLYLGKKPVLVLIKNVSGNKKPIVLRLWDSNITIKGTEYELWVGSVGAVPRTYSWLINYRNDFNLSPDILFAKPPQNYVIKSLTVMSALKHKQHTQQMLLLKPTHLS